MHSSRRAAPQSNAGRFGIRTGAGNAKTLTPGPARDRLESFIVNLLFSDIEDAEITPAPALIPKFTPSVGDALGHLRLIITRSK